MIQVATLVLRKLSSLLSLQYKISVHQTKWAQHRKQLSTPQKPLAREKISILPVKAMESLQAILGTVRMGTQQT
jgi:hypothetical protein